MFELREIKCVLVLSEQLHFGRTARVLHVSQSRVSQTVADIEQRLGAQLFERTSRRVVLTALGIDLIAQLRPLYEQLTALYSETVAMARGMDGTLRLGFVGAAAGRHATDLTKEFQRMVPECGVTLHEIHFDDLFGPLRRNEVDLMVVRLPVREPDLKVGPVIASESRVLAVPLGHPVAMRQSVSFEEVAAETVFSAAGTAPDYWWEYHVPSETPDGRKLRRGQQVSTCHEVLSLVAAGHGVAPMSESAAHYYYRSDVAFVHINDLPPTHVSLVWRAAAENKKIRALLRCATQQVERSHEPDRAAAQIAALEHHPSARFPTPSRFEPPAA
ncbi:LysR family transcriptional regulator [Streptomyces lydicus]